MVSKRFLSLTSKSLLGSSEIVLELQQRVVSAMALELTLLLSGLVESLRLKPSKGPSITLRLLTDERVSKAIATRVSGDAILFELGRNQAEYLQAVLLRAYRDQVAEVNHVHIEGLLSDTSFDLTIVFGSSREPMSAEEAENLLKD